MRAAIIVAVSFVLAGCDAPQPPGNTGGTNVEPGACGRGLVVVDSAASNESSSNVSLVAPSGRVLSSSIVSASSAPAALSSALSADVVPPTMATTGDELVLVDRYNGALTWVDVRNGAVRAQLDIKTGFASNPQDYVEVAPHKAYVTRAGSNAAPGSQPFDGGEDLLIVDPRAPKITGRIDLAAAMTGTAAGYPPSPTLEVLVGGTLYVLLAAYDFGGAQTGTTSRIVAIDTATDAIVQVTPLDGFHDCTALARNDAGDRLAVACTGGFSTDASGNFVGDLAQAGVVVLDGLPAPKIAHSVRASRLGDQALGFSVSFVNDHAVFVTSFGDRTTGTGDRAFVVDTETGDVHEARTTETAFMLGGVRCLVPCSACFLADAETNALVRFPIEGDSLGSPESIAVDPEIGLPPLYIGGF